jgi:hypothetical protein
MADKWEALLELRREIEMVKKLGPAVFDHLLGAAKVVL